MIRPHIIGLSGPAGCGKNTVALLLATHLRFAHLALADVLREEICQAFGVDMSVLTRRDTKETPNPALALRRCSTQSGFAMAVLDHQKWLEPDMTEHFVAEYTAPRSARQIMDWWETDYRRTCNGPDYFTRMIKVRVHLQQQCGQMRHVISDVRFDNEAQAVRAMGGVIWQIKRPGIECDASHASETDGSRFAPDLVINNCHDLRHLQMLTVGAWVSAETGLRGDDLVDMGAAHERVQA